MQNRMEVSCAGNYNADEQQIGGDHYKGAIQPWNFIISNNLGYLEGTAIKYLTRWRKKNGIEDLRKAVHFIEKLIEVETAKLPTTSASKPPMEFYTNVLYDRHPEFSHDSDLRLCSLHDVATKTGYSFPIPSGELNDEVILREDNDDV